MNVRFIKDSDLPILRQIWKTHFQDEFKFPDFLKFHLNYIIEDKEGLVTAGGIKLIPEAVLVTDKDKGIFTRYRALKLANEMNKYFCQSVGMEQVHTFIQDPIYKELLVRHHGFSPTKGDALVCWSDDNGVNENGEGRRF